MSRLKSTVVKITDEEIAKEIAEKETIDAIRRSVIQMGVAAHETVGICFQYEKLADLTYQCLKNAKKFSFQKLDLLKAISAIMLKTPAQYRIVVLQYIQHTLSVTKSNKVATILSRHKKLLNANQALWLKIMAWSYGVPTKDLKHEKWNNDHWSEKAVKVLQYQVDKKKMDIQQLSPQLLLLDHWQLIRWSHHLDASFETINSAQAKKAIDQGFGRLNDLFARLEKMKGTGESKGEEYEVSDLHLTQDLRKSQTSYS